MALEKEKRGLVDQSSTYDLKTGEVEDGALVWIPKKAKSQFGKGWFQMAQKSLQTINAHRKDLGLEGIVVFNALMARLDWENFIQVSQSEIADELAMKPSNVSRAVKKLVDLGFIRLGPKVGRSFTYQLHPELAWKGESQPHFKAREMARKQGWTVISGGKDAERIEDKDQPELPFPT